MIDLPAKLGVQPCFCLHLLIRQTYTLIKTINWPLCPFPLTPLGTWAHNAVQMQSNTATEQDTTIQTSLRFDVLLHEQARLLAFKKKTTFQQIVNEALRAYLAKQKAA